MTTKTTARFMLGAVVCLNGITTMAAPKHEKCDEFYYYDHGTDHCEHCRDLCDAASVKGTMDQCWKQCQSYALVLWQPKEASPTPAHPKSGEENDKSSDDSHFPLAAQIIIPLLSIVAVIGLVALGLVMIRRRTNARKNQRQRAPVRYQNVDQTAIILPDHLGENDDSAVDASTRATNGTGGSSSTGGIQEEGAGAFEEGNQAGGRETTVAQPMSSHLDNVPERTVWPVPVSPEGNSASFAIALPQSPVGPVRLIPTAPELRVPSLPDDDLDSTELKTLLPSMSDDSLLPGPREN